MSAPTRMPVVFLPHGGGPYSYVDLGRPKEEVDALAGYWRTIGPSLPQPPRAALVVSAHWEQPVPTVMTSPKPPLLFDYYGFPPASYELSWPAPGSADLAQRVQELLRAADIPSATDAARGFDHGTFVPMGRVFPQADVPTIQLSLRESLDPAEHLALGKALTPLRDEGVLIVGSGMSYHNMRGFFKGEGSSADARFDAWLHETVRADRATRDAALLNWAHAPAAREAHPREEHLLPLMVVAGAAGDDAANVPFHGRVFGKLVSAVHFG
ncbi:MAG: class III extradiol ring-cleavage dioxygenase [Myxococcota bacterium]